MPVEILLPAVTADMTETTIDAWLFAEGDRVSAGEALLEVETDKAVVEVEAPQAGTLAKVLIGAGQSAQVGQCIGLLLQEGEGSDAIDQFLAGLSTASSSPEAGTTAPSTASGPAQAPQPNNPTPSIDAGTNGRAFASPVARRIAAESGIDLSSLLGSGPRNRVVKKDVLAATNSGGCALASTTAEPQPAAQVESPMAPLSSDQKQPSDSTQPYEAIPHSGMRKVIAKRLGESKREVPHFYLSVDLELDALLALRKELNARAETSAADYKLSVNDLVIKASALALKGVPEANARWTDDAIHRYRDVDISVAVATDTGLITPIIRHADQKGLMTLSNEMKSLAVKAKEGKLQPHEYQGGGFTISNLGMFGIKQFSAIVNPPQSCILAVGAGEQRPVVRDGELAVATVMTCTLSVDHRSVDGAVGARFMAAFKRYIEDPISMIL